MPTQPMPTQPTPTPTHKSITAAEAKALAEAAAQRELPLLISCIAKAIEGQAALGRRCLHHPYDRLPSIISDVDRRSIRQHFEMAGFIWTHSDFQDPGSPGDRPYDCISW
jgi:hypothetical protein